MEGTTISDKGLGVFAFAIYHQLESGNRVTQVVMDNGSGHHADNEGVAELQGLGLIAIENERVRFTDSGELMIARMVDAMKTTASKALP